MLVGMVRKLALVYAAIVCAAVVWMWALEVAYRGSDQEHLLPAIVLFVLTFPTSAVIALCSDANGYCGQYGQLALITGCGVAQVVIVMLVARWFEGARARKRESGKDPPSRPRHTRG